LIIVLVEKLSMSSSSLVGKNNAPSVSLAQAIVAAARANLTKMEVIAAEALKFEAHAAAQSKLAEANAVAAKATLAAALAHAVAAKAALAAALADAAELEVAEANAAEPKVAALADAVAVLPEEETDEEETDEEETDEEESLRETIVTATQKLCNDFDAKYMIQFHATVRSYFDYLLCQHVFNEEELRKVSRDLTSLMNHIVQVNDAVLPEEETGEETDEEETDEEESLRETIVTATQKLCNDFDAGYMIQFHDTVRTYFDYLLWEHMFDEVELRQLSRDLTRLKIHIVQVYEAFDLLERHRGH